MEPNDVEPTAVDPPLQIEARGERRTRVLALRGELDPHTAPFLQEEVDRCLRDGVDEVTLDLTELRFIDSSGLRVLVSVHQELDNRGGLLVLRSPSATAARLFEITGLADHLHIEADPDGPVAGNATATPGAAS